MKFAPPLGCGIPRIQEWDEEAPADASDDESIVEISAPRAKSKPAPELSQDDEDEIDTPTAPTGPVPSTPSISTKRHRFSGSKVDLSPPGPAAKRPKFANFVKAAAIISALGFLQESPPLKVFERACVVFDGRVRARSPSVEYPPADLRSTSASDARKSRRGSVVATTNCAANSARQTTSRAAMAVR